MHITPPDIIISLILVFFAFNGFRHGFIEEIGKILSLVGGFIFASKFHEIIIPFLKPYIDSGVAQVTLAYLLIFILVVMMITIITKIVQKFIELVLLGWLNRLLGVLLGLLKGFLITSLLIFIIQAIPIKIDKENTIREKMEKESVMYQICNHVKDLVILTIPMDNKLNLLDKTIYEDINEENIQKIFK